jgi:hypothetical protein
LGFEFVLMFGAEESEALFFEGDAAGDEFAAAKGDDVGEEGADVAEFGLGVFGEVGGFGDGGEAKREPLDEVLDARESGGGLVGRILGGEAGGEFKGGVLDLRFAEGAFAVLGEVAAVDGFAVEVSVDDGLDFGEGVEPQEDGVWFLGVVEALIELIADLARETGEFA